MLMCRVSNTPSEMYDELSDTYECMGFDDAPSEEERKSLEKAAEFAFSDKCNDILNKSKKEILL